jgi:hypothetical protein
MLEAVASTVHPRRGRGQPRYEPTQNERDLVSILTGFAIGQEVIVALFKRKGVRCTSIPTLRRAFRAELASGREQMISTLGMRMFHLATTDGPHSFQACAFLLRTWGGPQWRLPKGEDGDDPQVPTDEPNGVRIILPHNFREAPPPDAIVEEPPTIDAEFEPT